MKKKYLKPYIECRSIYNEESLASGSVYPTTASGDIQQEWETEEQTHSFNW